MATSLTVPDLILRLVKGQPLTAEEMDGNFETLRDFCNSLAELLGASIKPDGALKDASVGTDAYQNRSIVKSKLAGTAMPYYEDGSTTINEMVIAPDPAFTAYEDGQIFFIRAATNNTSTVTIKLNALTAKALKKRGGLDIESGDITTGQIICVCYRGGVFELVAGSSAGGGSGSSSASVGIVTFSPADVALPTSTPPQLAGNYTHGLGASPTKVVVALSCVTNDAGFSAQDLVPIHQAIDGGGNEVFTVQVNSARIAVNMTAAPSLIHPTTGTLTPIDVTKWKLRVYAELATSVATPTFPALVYTCRTPLGAWGNGTDLFLAELRAGTATTTRINIANNNVTKVEPAASNPYLQNVNAAPFRRANGDDNFLIAGWYNVFGAGAIYYQPTAAPYQPVLLTTTVGNVTWQRKILHITESGGNIVQVLAAGYRGELVNSITLYANTAYNHGGSIGNISGAVGTALDLTSNNILNASGVAGNDEFRALVASGEQIQFLQYNRLKKRLYVIGSELMMLSIFQIVGDTSAYTDPNSLLEWWLDAARYSKLQYIKSIAIAGGGDVLSDTRDNAMIDVDLSTGDERAIIFTRSGNATAGSLTRIPWKE